MHIPRFYIPDEIIPTQVLQLHSDAGLHISRVLRMKCDQQVTLFNGKGGQYLATIVNIERHRVTVRIDLFVTKNTESPLKLTLIQCISRGDRMDYTIQKSVELGVNQILPVYSQRGIVLDSKRALKKLKHWQKVVISACEQSGRDNIPVVLQPIKIAEALKMTFDKSDLKLIMHTSDDATTPYTLSSVDQNIRHCVLLAGPEGGLSHQEVSLALQQKFQVIQLGPRVLRTETAALSLISILQSRAGDMC
ncbi:16S rRNA (uracil(1498)-N(3))-methyltransferase [hydrothermal vent metagenome]|uniref:16S rRNA (uracil(1498)-N(3))-methyltransferase n=1 Tax=hydrothermal vent metagenome TaxID=652676 RepID=A0A3B0ZMS4_9ZZZZ